MIGKGKKQFFFEEENHIFKEQLLRFFAPASFNLSSRNFAQFVAAISSTMMMMYRECHRKRR
jgi:hypothetical protein